MVKENHYLAEKVISKIKKYKVIDEIILSNPQSISCAKEKEVVENKETIFENIKNNQQVVNLENKIIQAIDNKTPILESSKKEINKLNSNFDIEFSDNNQNIVKPINFNSSLANKKGIDMSNNINQKYFENHSERDQNIDSYDLNNDPSVVSMVDLLSEDNLSSIDDLNNIVNIDDVYDDLGQNFQNDLMNQYNELDKSVSHTPNSLKYSYLPKRKIRDILFDKYNIRNEECVNELYSMAFNNKWKEIDVEHWLLNPINIDNLISKCCGDSFIPVKPAKKENNSDNQPINDNVVPKILANNENVEKKFHEPKVEPRIIPQNNIIEAKPIFSGDKNPFYSVKDDLKSVLIEENYRKMQFDFQTEVLKNHIDAKFNSYNNSNSFSDNRSNLVDKKINEEFINSKIELFFNEKKSDILNEITNLKEKFTKNEKVIWDSLDFIRKEMKQNHSSLTSSVSDSLTSIKNEIENSLNSYVEDIQNKQMDSLNDFFKNLENKDALVPLKESFDQKFESLSQDINQLKQNFNEKNNNLSIEFLDLRKDINDRVNTISSELMSNINSLYDEVEHINNSLKNGLNNSSLDETDDDLFTRISRIQDNKNDNDLINKSINDKNLDDSKKNVKNEDDKNSDSNEKYNFLDKDIEKENKPNYLDYLENDSVNFDNINSFNEQDMNYDIVDTNSNNIDFDYLKSSSDEFKENQINDFNYDDNELSKNDRDFYKNFISDIPSEVNNSSKLVSNFDSKKVVSNLDLENTKEVVSEKKDEFDIKSKLSKIDEIIRNSINELNDIKEIVDDGEVRIDDSIKLFEKVK